MEDASIDNLLYQQGREAYIKIIHVLRLVYNRFGDFVFAVAVLGRRHGLEHGVHILGDIGHRELETPSGVEVKEVVELVGEAPGHELDSREVQYDFRFSGVFDEIKQIFRRRSGNKIGACCFSDNNRSHGTSVIPNN